MTQQVLHSWKDPLTSDSWNDKTLKQSSNRVTGGLKLEAVNSGTSLDIKITAGSAIVNGAVVVEDSDVTTITGTPWTPPASGSIRMDYVICRFARPAVTGASATYEIVTGVETTDHYPSVPTIPYSSDEYVILGVIVGKSNDTTWDAQWSNLNWGNTNNFGYDSGGKTLSDGDAMRSWSVPNLMGNPSMAAACWRNRKNFQSLTGSDPTPTVGDGSIKFPVGWMVHLNDNSQDLQNYVQQSATGPSDEYSLTADQNFGFSKAETGGTRLTTSIFGTSYGTSSAYANNKLMYQINMHIRNGLPFLVLGLYYKTNTSGVWKIQMQLGNETVVESARLSDTDGKWEKAYISYPMIPYTRVSDLTHGAKFIITSEGGASAADTTLWVGGVFAHLMDNPVSVEDIYWSPESYASQSCCGRSMLGYGITAGIREYDVSTSIPAGSAASKIISRVPGEHFIPTDNYTVLVSYRKYGDDSKRYFGRQSATASEFVYATVDEDASGDDVNIYVWNETSDIITDVKAFVLFVPYDPDGGGVPSSAPSF